MSKLIVLPVTIVLLAVAMSAFTPAQSEAPAQNEAPEVKSGKRYEVNGMKMYNRDVLCIVDHQANKAHLYTDQGRGSLGLFKSIDMSKAGNQTIEYVE